MSEGSTLNKRENNYDLLRIISTIGVISIHVSSDYIQAFGNGKFTHGLLTTFLYNLLPCFAVPCFVMLTGAFDLANDRNANFKYFYKKIFRNIGIPTIIFCVFVFLKSIVKTVYHSFSVSSIALMTVSFLKKSLRGELEGHTWYLSMMFFIWLLIPIIIRFKNVVSKKSFCIAACLMIIASSVCHYFREEPILKWDIGYSIYFVGYIMLGYVLRSSCRFKKNNVKGIALILLGFAVECILTYLSFKGTLNGTSNYKLIGPLAPLVVVASVLIFTGFSLINIKTELGGLAKHSFIIYLYHLTITYILSKIVFSRFADVDNKLTIPLMIVAIFLISLLVAILYNAIWKRLDKNGRISDKLCSILRLN